jgi:hypothetical protein
VESKGNNNNEHLREGLPKYREGSTVEGIALKLGIDLYDLFDWAKTDEEFSQTLESLVTAMKEDPFKTGGVEDSQANTMLTVLTLVEFRDRQYEPPNKEVR